jgi:hypothetical protein
MTVQITRPTDDYDPNWPTYWAANPHLLRAVGADSAGEGEGGGEGGAGGEGEGAGGEGGDGGQAADGGGEGKQGGAESGEQWYSGISNEDVRGVASKFKSEKEFHDALGIEVGGDDWRSGITDEKLRDHAGRFTTVQDLAKAHLDLRSQLAKAIVPPGKDAKPEQIAAYRKSMGIPETADGYEFPAPAEGEELTDEMKEQQAGWRERFHSLNLPAETAKALVQMVTEDAAATMAKEVEADKQFADTTEAAMKEKWGTDYDRNTEAAKRAITTLAERAGLDVEQLSQKELKNGRFLFDDPDLRQLMAPIGLEMQEGNLGPALTEGERDSIQERLTAVRAQIGAAQAAGDNKKANALYQEEQKLIAKQQGNQPVVGAHGRAA